MNNNLRDNLIDVFYGLFIIGVVIWMLVTLFGCVEPEVVPMEPIPIPSGESNGPVDKLEFVADAPAYSLRLTWHYLDGWVLHVFKPLTLGGNEYHEGSDLEEVLDKAILERGTAKENDE